MLENLDCIHCTYLAFTRPHCGAGRLFLQHMELRIFPNPSCTASPGWAGDLEAYRDLYRAQQEQSSRLKELSRKGTPRVEAVRPKCFHSTCSGVTLDNSLYLFHFFFF